MKGTRYLSERVMFPGMIDVIKSVAIDMSILVMRAPFFGSSMI
jgi:hypothetical protein